MRTLCFGLAIVLLTAWISGVWVPGRASAQSEDLSAPQRRVDELYRAGKYADAAKVAEQYVLAARARYGDDHGGYAPAIAWLGHVYWAQRRYAEAEPLYRRALAIAEKSFGPEHPNVAAALNNLAQLLRATNRLSEAEPLMRRGLAIEEKSRGPDHPFVAIQLNNLTQLLMDTNRLSETELTTRAFAEVKAKPAIGRAEALRISMRELMEKGTLAEAHPSLWAPFVVVGEGGR